MSVMEAQRHAQEIRTRLRNPPNAVMDHGIDLKRKVIPIVPDILDVFGPKSTLTPEDEAFGPIVRPAEIIYSAIEDIQRAVCAKYKLTRLELISDRRTKQIVRPRHIAIYLSRLLTPRSLPEIGRRFGGLDHTSVLHGARKIDALRKTDAVLDGEVIELIETITA